MISDMSGVMSGVIYGYKMHKHDIKFLLPGCIFHTAIPHCSLWISCVANTAVVKVCGG